VAVHWNELRGWSNAGWGAASLIARDRITIRRHCGSHYPLDPGDDFQEKVAAFHDAGQVKAG